MRITKSIKDKMLAILANFYHDAKPALIFKNPFELLIAVILSAQCTDTRVNKTTKELFKKVSEPQDIIDLGLLGLEEAIKNCGLYHNKAKNILATAEILVRDYEGKVPSSYELLLKLPGVGRKTANVVTSLAFHRDAIAVDTHVFRVANRLKLAVGKTPLEVELLLQKAIPKKDWSKAHHWLIFHGRKFCKKRKPLCENCPLSDLCPSKE